MDSLSIHVMLTNAVGDKMSIIIDSLIVFSTTLIITKSSLLACKRQYVTERFNAAKVNGRPSLLHRWWNAIWNCPMCCGFWIAFIVTCDMQQTIIVFGVNWLLHCVESFLFNSGKFLESIIDEPDNLGIM